MTAALSKPVVGLLGAPGAGKSFVAEQFRQLGTAVIDADALARDALQAPDVREQLVQWWGPGVLDAQGHVDRQAVGRIVFNDPEALKQLESLTHPKVRESRAALRERYDRDPAVKAIVEDSPLLLEKGLDAECDVLVLVDAPREVRLERLARDRGWSAAELDRREKNQWPLDNKRQRADHVVNNHAGAESVADQVRRVFFLILQNRDQATR